MIFDYWKIWMNVSVESNIWCNEGSDEGLMYYDGNLATFWYMLNVEWYRMNDKLYAYTGCTEPFDKYLRDFDEEYINENWG